MEKDFSGVANYNVAIREWDEKIVFLHKIVPGSADKSYGIHVARIAGVPNWVNQRAEQILQKLENSGEVEANQQAIKSADTGVPKPDAGGRFQLTMFGTAHHPLVDKIKALDANQMTPIKALQTLHQWQSELEEESSEADSGRAETIES